MGEMRNAYSTFIGKPEEKSQLGRPRLKWEEVDWMNLAQDRNQWRAVVKTVIKFWVPYKAGEFIHWLSD
jgi:hypothetical protein